MTDNSSQTQLQRAQANDPSLTSIMIYGNEEYPVLCNALKKNTYIMDMGKLYLSN